MFDIPAFTRTENHIRPMSAPLLCWDMANLDLDRRVRIQHDIEQLDCLTELYQWKLDKSYHPYLIDNCTLVITNLSKEIIWASRAFRPMTGYETDDIIGKKPSFLQGKRTNLQTLKFISEKLSNFEPLAARILNYRKSGEAYWCGIRIAPVQNNENVVTHFIAIEKEVN